MTRRAGRLARLGATVLLGAALGGSVSMATPAGGDRLAGLPRLVVWAWERPEDLTFLDVRTAGVAFLARTVYLRGERVVVRPRLAPLAVPPGAGLVAVVRLESEGAPPPALTSAQRAAAVSAVAAAGSLPRVVAVQTDFDARLSERPFYRALLTDLRRTLPASLALSMTALASWCLGDPWLAGVPVDEAVPMLFRMGPDRRPAARHLEDGGDFAPGPCRHALGVSTDEPLLRLPPGRRLYVFHPRPWSPEAVQALLAGAGR